MKIKNLIVIVFVIAALLALKYFMFPSKSTATGSPAGQSKPMPSAVTACVAKPEKITDDVYATGTILANEEAELKPEIAGRIVQLLFKEGSAVTKGQLLVKINDADFQAQLKKLQLEAQLADAQLKREVELSKINGISQQDIEITQNKVSTLKADIDYVQSQITKTEVRAPFNGQIGLKNVSEGAYVTPATIIANIQQINPVKLDFTVSERYADIVKVGDKVIFNVDGIKKDLTGEVFAVEPKIDLATRSLRMRAICPNNSGRIFPGAYARIKLALADIDAAIMIPSEAIVPDMKGKKVICVKNGVAEFVKVETGLRTDAKIQIVNGISIGDTIVTTGIMQLKPGASVKIIDLK